MNHLSEKIFVVILGVTIIASAITVTYTDGWWSYPLSLPEVEVEVPPVVPIRLTHAPTREVEAVWSPDGKMIAYVSQEPDGSTIWVMNADGTGKRQLTPVSMNATWPRWRPDGGMIAFVSFRERGSDLWVMYSDGSEKVNYTNDTASEGPPEWSPDGSMIVYESDRAGNWDVWTVCACGTTKNRLTTHSADDRYPSWGPDGKKIVFASNRSGNFDIWIMNNDGSGQEQLTSDPEDDIRPKMNSLGDAIAYLSNQTEYEKSGYVVDWKGAGTWCIQIVDLLGKKWAYMQQQTWLLHDNDSITWTPDGRAILFPSYGITILYGIYIEPVRFTIFMVSVDGTNFTQVTPIAWKSSTLHMNSDGTELAYIYVDRYGNVDVYVIPLAAAVQVAAPGY